MQRKHCRIASLADLAATFAGLAALIACENSPAAIAHDEGGESTAESALQTSCEASAPTACVMPTPHYPDIAPILQKSCNPCHDGESGPWPLTDYDDVAAWDSLIQHDLSTCDMPPLDGGVPLTAADRRAILDWVQCGDPQ
jgi:hypothetical protein